MSEGDFLTLLIAFAGGFAAGFGVIILIKEGRDK